MSQWGRPPGAKGSKRRIAWERTQALWNDRARIQELDSDYDIDTHGVEAEFSQRRFDSDPLRFTGIDLSSKPRARRVYTYDSESSEAESDSDYGGEVQIALHEKEKALVQSALARIHRAHEKGKKEVKLKPEELAAMDKRKRLMELPNTLKSKKGRRKSGGSGSDKKRRDDRIAVPLSQLEPTSRKSRGKRDYPPPSAPPGMLIEGPDGSLTYAALGSQSSQSSSAHGSPSRQRPRSGTQTRSTPPPSYPRQVPSTSNSRYFSEGNHPSSASNRHPIPHEEEWYRSDPRRSSLSNAQMPNVFDYQIVDDPSVPPQYRQYPEGGRRNVSGPDLHYSPATRPQPVSNVYPASVRRARNQASSSDPTLGRRRDLVEISSTEYDDESDELSSSVQVIVEEDRRDSIPRKPVGGSSKSKKKGKGR
jgi:hypothetical protein